MMLRRLYLGLLISIIICSPLFAQIVISSFDDNNIAVLNEELRRLGVSGSKADDVTLEKVNGRLQIKLTPVSVGGLGDNFSTQSKGSILFFKDTGDIEALEYSTPDTVLMSRNNDIIWGNVNALSHISTTAFATVDTVVPVSDGKRYFVYVDGTQNAAIGTLKMRFNSDDTNLRYEWRWDETAYSTTSSGTHGDATAINLIDSITSDTPFSLYFNLNTNSDVITKEAFVDWTGNSTVSTDGFVRVDGFGAYDGPSDVTDFEFLTSAGTVSGTVYLYEYQF